MTLVHLIRQLDQLDDDFVLYAEPRWRPSSRAVAAFEPDDGAQPVVARGMTYLVSVRQAKRIAATRRSWLGDRADDVHELCRAIIYYGVYDEVEPAPSTIAVLASA